VKIIVLGAGQVGSTVARSLALEGNEVTVVDIDIARLKEVDDSSDVKILVGPASYPDVLRKAGAEDCDMIIAATNSDETNIVAIQIAYTLYKTPAKIARIRSREYMREKNLFNNEHIPIDVIISPEDLVTDHIRRIIEHPGAIQVLDFARGTVRMVGVEVQRGAPMAGLTLARLPDLLGDFETRVMAVYRGDEVIIPTGTTLIREEDNVFFLSERKHTAAVMSQFHHEDEPCKRVMIAGGGNIGRLLAQKLERHYRVKIIEANETRTTELASDLSSTMVLHGDVANQDMLRDEGVEQMDVFCALTNDDEANILSAMLAKRLGARKIMSLIGRPAYVELVERNIIDVAISPQQITIGALLTLIRRGDVVAVHSLRRGSAEALEGVAHGDRDTSKLVGRTIGEIKLPKSANIGIVVRGDEVLIGHHDLMIEPEDHLIVLITNTDQVADVEKLFQVSVTFV
jgi:trk system potassium uptake protein TrkA